MGYPCGLLRFTPARDLCDQKEDASELLQRAVRKLSMYPIPIPLTRWLLEPPPEATERPQAEAGLRLEQRAAPAVTSGPPWGCGRGTGGFCQRPWKRGGQRGGGGPNHAGLVDHLNNFQFYFQQDGKPFGGFKQCDLISIFK